MRVLCHILACLLACGSVAEAQEMRDRYVLRSVKVEGQVKGKNAELTITLLADTMTDRGVRIPLRLDECIITDQQFAGGARQQSLQDAGKRGGYAWRLEGKAEGCRLTIKALVPLKTVAGETQLVLTLPQEKQAQSEFKLLVPGDVELGQVLGGEHPGDPVTKAAGTEFTFRRLSGQLTISWHARQKLIREAKKLRARVFIKSRFDVTNKEFRSDVKITVMSFGGKFDRFQVQLPPGASLESSNPHWVVVTQSAEKGHLLTVRHEPALRYSLSLVLVHPYDMAAKQPAPRQPVELAAIGVLGALRQWGYLALESDDQSQVRWSPLTPQHIERIAAADLPKEFHKELKLTPADARAAFELFSPEASLAVRGFRSRPRIRVEPEYVVILGREQLRLDAALHVSVDRAAASHLELELPPGEEWQVQPVGPDTLVQATTVDPLPTNPKARNLKRKITVLLRNSVTGSFELRLTAQRRLLPQEDQAVSFRLPQPVAQVLNPRLWVQAADHVALEPPTIAGLTEQTLPADKPAPLRAGSFGQSPLFYQIGSLNSARFSTEMKLHARKLSVGLSGEVTFKARQVHVDQRLAYNVQHQPISQLALRLPEDFADVEPLTFYLNDQRIEDPRFSEDMPGETVEGKTQPRDASVKWLLLPAAIDPGEFTLRVVHSRPWTPSADAGPLAVPLVMPAEGELVENTLGVSTEGDLLATLAPPPGELPQPWQAVTMGPKGLRGDELQLTAREAVAAVWLTMTPVQLDAEDNLIVHQLWVQTWIEKDRRVDRWVCRFSGAGQPLQLHLPEGAEGTVVVVLDGRQLSVAADEQNMLSIPLKEPASSERRPHVLLVQYQMPGARRAVASLEVARLPEQTWINHTYWQLILPEDQHLVVSPPGVTREFAWRWQGWFWNRAAFAEHADLAAALDVKQLPAPPINRNRYLFSTLGPPPTLRVTMAGRTSLLLSASGIVFGVGLLVLNVRLLRRRHVLAVAALVLLVLALMFPEAMLIVAQAASLGLAAVLLMGLLTWLLATARPMIPLRMGGGSTTGASAVMEMGSTRLRSAERASSQASGSGSTGSSVQGDSVEATAGDSAL